ncbi:hypothetical protein [Falsiroseomonas sp.]|uniref:hypothetical protein n=1 Tax=Falsiroseomonas sp. TaxID=2870721 RepID=UPI003F6F42B6
MPDLLTARRATFLKADPQTHSSALGDADKLAIAAGDVLEAPDITQEEGHFVARGGRLNGRPLPAHLVYAHAGHWTLAEGAAAPAAPPAAASAAGKTPEDRKPEVLALLAEGRSVSAIAKELRIGRAFIKRWRDGA